MFVVAFLSLLTLPVAYGQCDPESRPLIVDTDLAVIQSPGYDGSTPYPNDQLCEWLVISPQDVELTFFEFQLEDCINCGCDYLSIYDGHNDTAPLLRTLCGGNLDSLPYKITSSSQMFIRFESDSSNSGQVIGFTSRVKFLDAACESENGKNLYGPTGSVVSPNYPSNYPIEVNCFWNFKVPEGQFVEIQFNALDVQPGCLPGFIDGFPKDYVQFVDSDRRTSLGRWFGDQFVPGFTFQNHQTGEPYLQFYSDFEVTAPGFNLTYTFGTDVSI